MKITPKANFPLPENEFFAFIQRYSGDRHLFGAEIVINKTLLLGNDICATSVAEIQVSFKR